MRSSAGARSTPAGPHEVKGHAPPAPAKLRTETADCANLLCLLPSSSYRLTGSLPALLAGCRERVLVPTNLTKAPARAKWLDTLGHSLTTRCQGTTETTDVPSLE